MKKSLFFFLSFVVLGQVFTFAQSKKELTLKNDSLLAVNLNIENKNKSLLNQITKLKKQKDSTITEYKILKKEFNSLIQEFNSYKDSVNKKQEEVFYVKGAVVDESYGFDPDLDWIEVYDMHGDLKGQNIKIYTRTLNNIKYKVECKGNIHLDSSSYMHMQIVAKIIRSTGEFHNRATPGTHKKEIWRPIELFLDE